MISVLIIVLVPIAAAGGGIYLYVTRLGRIPAGHVGIVHRHFPGIHPDDKFDVRTHKSAGPQANGLALASEVVSLLLRGA
jgi:hypothetical protein